MDPSPVDPSPTDFDETSPAIVSRGASKLFLDGTVVAFRQLTLAVRHQEIFVVVGPSGCGKTTFLRCIAGLTDLTSGELLVAGKPVAGPPDGVAMVFQHFGLLPWKTVYDNAAFSNTVFHGKRPKCWNTMATPSGGPFTGLSPTRISPVLRSISPARQRRKVVLPQPLGPTTTRIS